MGIAENYNKIRKEIPKHVAIVLAVKERSKDEVLEAINAGATDIGQNYVQETLKIYSELKENAKKVRWHMIGHLQKSKINNALKVFDVIQTIDSYELAEAIDKRVKSTNKKIIPILIEINIGSEISKYGLEPDYETIKNWIIKISKLQNIKVEGLMTMGPMTGDPEKVRPYFRKTKEIFERIKKLNLKNVDMKTLSMGMSNSYKAAIEEGSNMVRLGTVIFGKR